MLLLQFVGLNMYTEELAALSLCSEQLFINFLEADRQDLMRKYVEKPAQGKMQGICSGRPCFSKQKSLE